MEQTPQRACKYVLTTYHSETGDGSEFYDTTFNLRPPFRPNSNGVYKVTINEALFKNNEPTLQIGDYMKYTITCDDNSKYTHTISIRMDLYTYDDEKGTRSEICKILKGLKHDDAGGSQYVDSAITAGLTVNISLRNAQNTTKEYTGDDALPQTLRLIYTPTVAGKTVTKIEMEYSTNFAYLLNNLSAKRTRTGTVGTFEFTNLRLCGAYIYIIETPIQSTVNTYNANNQGYNIVAMTYNTGGLHNSIQQCISSMECTTNDLSNLRFRLVNDQYEPVRINEPLYVQITVSNED